MNSILIPIRFPVPIPGRSRSMIRGCIRSTMILKVTLALADASSPRTHQPIAAEDTRPAFEVPSIREYFVDLDYVLSVISDGPTKSYAFRRLKYLSGKFTMYSLLNEYQELAEMKVR